MSIIQSKFGKQGWYPNSRQSLIDYIRHTLPNENVVNQDNCISVVVCPHAGYQYCGDIIADVLGSTCHQTYKRIVILSTNHYLSINNQIIVPSADRLETELGFMDIDTSACHSLLDSSYFVVDDQGIKNEHGVWMSLPMLQVLHPNTPVLPMVVTHLNINDITAISDMISYLIDDSLLLISGDFTHYGAAFNYTPFDHAIADSIKKIDDQALTYILNNDFDGFWGWITTYHHTICGQMPLGLMLHMIRSENMNVDKLIYRQSAQLSQDWNQSVSYVGITINKSIDHD